MGKLKKILTTHGGGEEAPWKTPHLTLYCAFQLVVLHHFLPCIPFIPQLPGESVSQLFYQLSTPQNKFLLNLTLQGGLLSRQFRVEYWKRGRLAWSRPYSSRCQYVGHLQDQPHSSKVALSNCNGLVSVTRQVSFRFGSLTMYLAILVRKGCIQDISLYFQHSAKDPQCRQLYTLFNPLLIASYKMAFCAAKQMLFLDLPLFWKTEKHQNQTFVAHLEKLFVSLVTSEKSPFLCGYKGSK